MNFFFLLVLRSLNVLINVCITFKRLDKRRLIITYQEKEIFIIISRFFYIILFEQLEQNDQELVND
jgi:hypothetical protein